MKKITFSFISKFNKFKADRYIKSFDEEKKNLFKIYILNILNKVCTSNKFFPTKKNISIIKKIVSVFKLNLYISELETINYWNTQDLVNIRNQKKLFVPELDSTNEYSVAIFYGVVLYNYTRTNETNLISQFINLKYINKYDLYITNKRVLLHRKRAKNKSYYYKEVKIERVDDFLIKIIKGINKEFIIFLPNINNSLFFYYLNSIYKANKHE